MHDVVETFFFIRLLSWICDMKLRSLVSLWCHLVSGTPGQMRNVFNMRLQKKKNTCVQSTLFYILGQKKIVTIQFAIEWTVCDFLFQIGRWSQTSIIIHTFFNFFLCPILHCKWPAIADLLGRTGPERAQSWIQLKHFVNIISHGDQKLSRSRSSFLRRDTKVKMNREISE